MSSRSDPAARRPRIHAPAVVTMTMQVGQSASDRPCHVPPSSETRRRRRSSSYFRRTFSSCPSAPETGVPAGGARWTLVVSAHVDRLARACCRYYYGASRARKRRPAPARHNTRSRTPPARTALRLRRVSARARSTGGRSLTQADPRNVPAPWKVVAKGERCCRSEPEASSDPLSERDQQVLSPRTSTIRQRIDANHAT